MLPPSNGPALRTPGQKCQERAQTIGDPLLVGVGQLAQNRLMQVSRVDVDIRKFVRSRATRAFLTAGGDWTTDPSTATVFPSTEAAREIVLKHRITDAELYYQFGEKPSQYDFTLSL